MKTLYRLALALAPAVLFGLYSARPAMSALNLVVLVPWIVLYTDPRSPRVSWAWYSLGAWVSWMTLHHATFRFGWFVPPAMGLVLGFFWHPFALALRRVHHRLHLPRSVSVAVLWVAVEWLRVTFTLANFDIYQLGYSLAPFPALVQVADVTGVYGVSFLIAATNGWIADAWFAFREGGAGAALRDRAVRRGAAALAIAAAAFAVYGAARLATLEVVNGPRLALVQPNLPHSRRNVMGVHLAQLDMTLERIEPGAVDLIVWPENAILDVLTRDPDYLSDLAWLADRTGAPILVGAQGDVPGRPMRATNSAYLVEPDGTIQARYDKQVLFPWSEFVPGDRLLMGYWPGFGRLHRLIARIGWGAQTGGVPGTRTTLFEIPWNGERVPFSTLICVENTNPRIPAAAGRLGARFFVNITSEGSVGGPTQEQLLRTAMFRAIENRMAYVRLGNTGISGMIDPTGRLTAVLRDERGRVINVPGVLVAPVPLAPDASAVYPKSRDAFVLAVLAAAVGLLVATFARGGGRGRTAVLAATVSLACASCSDPAALGRDPARAAAALDEGRARLEAGRTREAIAALVGACATAEACREALPLLASAYERSPFDDEAVARFQAVAERHPELATTALAFRGIFLERTLDAAGAESAYRRSLAERPDPVVRGRLALLLLRSGRSREALAEIEAGLADRPDHAGLRILLGRALRESADLAAASATLESVVADPDADGMATAWVELGRVRSALGDEPGARIAWETALETAPDDVPARFQLARAALRRGERDRARAWIDEILRLDGTIPAGGRR